VSGACACNCCDKTPTSGMTCFCIWLRTACSMPASVVNCSAECRVEYLGDRLDMFLEGLLLFGVMAGEELSTILSSLIRPAFEKVTCSQSAVTLDRYRLRIK